MHAANVLGVHCLEGIETGLLIVSPAVWLLQEAVLAAELVPSFAKRNPTFDGVCMGNRKACKCGAPFLG